MLIPEGKLQLSYWGKGSPCGGPAPIDLRGWGYELEPGQKVCQIFIAFRPWVIHSATVHEVSKDGIYTSSAYFSKEFIPWLEIKRIEPCPALFEKNNADDIFSGGIARETWKNGQLKKIDGEGIWREHGGFRRSHIKHAENLRNFVALDAKKA